MKKIKEENKLRVYSVFEKNILKGLKRLYKIKKGNEACKLELL